MRLFPATAEVYLPRADPVTGLPSAVPIGELWANPALGDTLESVATQGVAAFYSGWLAAEIVAAAAAAVNPVTNLAGRLALSDLAMVASNLQQAYPQNYPTSAGFTATAVSPGMVSGRVVAMVRNVPGCSATSTLK